MRNSVDKSEVPKMLRVSIELRNFFINHLNRIYCAKSHLAERLPEISIQAHFIDLKRAIRETLDDVERQIVRMDAIYVMLDTHYTFENCNGMIGMVEEAYDCIHESPDNLEMRDLAILFYLQHIESIEMSSFTALQLIAVKFENKQITQLLLENFDEAKDDRSLLVYITKKYLAN